jgi:transposase-like protein
LKKGFCQVMVCNLTGMEAGRLLDDLKKALAERILNAEMDHQLGQESEQAAGMRSMRIASDEWPAR